MPTFFASAFLLDAFFAAVPAALGFLAVVVFVVFFTAGFLTVVDAFLAVAGLAATAFLTGAFAAGLTAFVVFTLFGLAAGFAFYGQMSRQQAKICLVLTSLVASVLPLAESLTLPDGPFGRRKVPFSAPCVIARLS